MRFLKQIAILIFFSCIVQTLPAQPLQLSFQNFTEKEGLSDNNIHSFYQDSRGYLWICTTEGLNRFDGFTFRKYYATGQKNSLPSNIVYQVLEFTPGYLLISTSNGLAQLNMLSNTFEPVKNRSLSTKFTTTMSRDTNGDIMLCCVDGMFILDSNFKTKYFVKTDRSIFQTHRLRTGELLAATNGGHYIIDTGRRSLIPLSRQFKDAHFPHYLLFSYYDSLTNRLYTSEWAMGLFIIDLNTKTVTRANNYPGTANAIKTNIVYSAYRDNMQKLWIGSDKGLFMGSDTKLNVVQPEPGTAYGVVDNFIWKIYEDRNKNLWFGTAGGISRLNPKAQGIQQYKDEFVVKGKATDINGICRGNDNRLYVSTYGNGIFSLDEETKVVENIGREILPSNWSVEQEDDHIVATGHDKRIYYYYSGSKKITSPDYLSPFYGKSNLLLFSFTQSNGDKWYSMNEGAGLVWYNAKEKKYRQYTNKDIPAPFVESYFSIIKEDSAGNLWFAVNRSTNLVCWEIKTHEFKTIDIEKLSRPVVQNFAGISDIVINGKEIWLSTSGTGAILFNPAALSIQVFTMNDGLAGNVVNSLVLDNKIRLWACTTKGLSCRLPGQEYFSSFAASDGLPEINFNERTHYYDPVKNKMYLGAHNSVVVITPDDLLSNKGFQIRAHIDGIKVNGENLNYHEDENHNMGYDENNLQFNFSVVDLNSSSGINLYYRLSGADNNWINAGDQRSATYINLPPGAYQMELKIAKQGSDFTSYSKPFLFTIKQAWWKKSWFRALIALTALIVLYLIVRMYYRGKLEHQRMLFEKQQAVEQERTRIATDMHDDLGAGLTGIKFLSENISEYNISGAAKARLEKLRGSANKLIESMGEIIWAMNEKNNTLQDLLFHLRSYSLIYCEENTINCTFNLPETIPDQVISGQMRRNIFLIIKETLHNIVKHAGAKNVVINISLKKELVFEIQDDGKGFLQTDNAAGNGLINMKKRAKEMNGTYSISTHEGTQVILKIPVV